MGAGLVIVIGAAVTLGASAPPSGGAGASAAPTAKPEASGAPGEQGVHGGPSWLGGLFDGKAPGGDGSVGEFRGRLGFGAVTITAIRDSNVSLKTDDGWTRTIAVTNAMTITKGGQPIKVTDLAVGDQIGFRQTRNADGTWTIDRIDVVVPTVAGTVAAIGSDTITITDRSAASRTITTTPSTTYRLGNAAGSHADIKVGSTIVAAGTGSGQSFTATTVEIRQPTFLGTVTGTTGSTITVKRLDGSTLTIHVGAATTYDVRGTGQASLSDIKAGMTIIVAGTQNADGSVDAAGIHAGTFGRGGAWGKEAPEPSGSPEASSSQG